MHEVRRDAEEIVLVTLPLPPTIAVLDACVLYPAALRDTLLRTVEAGLYQLRWSEEILAEVRRNLVATGRQTESQAEALVTEMRRAFPAAFVEGYQGLIDSMHNHPKDRHVLAAAVAGRAGLIVTSNLRHFPDEAVDPYSIRVQSPDAFLSDLFQEEPDVIMDVLRDQAADLRDPPMSIADVITELQRDAPAFVAAVVSDLL